MKRKNGNTLIVVLLALIAILMASGVGFMYWDSKKKEQAARLEKAMAYFDKLESEERQAAEAERLKQEQAKLLAEQEKMRLALEQTQEDAKKAKAVADQRIAEKKQAGPSEEVKKNRNVCSQLYVGKSVSVDGYANYTKAVIVGIGPEKNNGDRDISYKLTEMGCLGKTVGSTCFSAGEVRNNSSCEGIY